MEHLDLVSLTPQAKTKKDRKNPFVNFFSKTSQNQSEPKKQKSPAETDKENEDDMFDILSRVQGSRYGLTNLNLSIYIICLSRS